MISATGSEHGVEPVYHVAILAGRLVFAAFGLRRRVEGAEHFDVPGGAVIAITHYSYLDFALTEWALWRRNGRRMRFLATARAFEHPIAGPLLRGMKHVPVERTAGGPSYAAAVRLLQSGEVVGVFPEAQVHRHTVGPLKTGAVRMAQEAGVPLVPVVVWGGQNLLTKGERFSLRRAWRAKVVIMVGEPSRVDTDVDAATGDLRRVLSSLTEQARRL